jgi:tetratricopeptide (TPR) repeat protein
MNLFQVSNPLMREVLSMRLPALAASLLVAACSRDAAVPGEPEQRPAFVGSEQCAACHETEYGRWQGSDHQLAMQPASKEFVLGDFSGPVLRYFDTETSFLERDGRYFVKTQNASGEIEDFEVTHTFGVTPLQQYLVEAPGGRKQALPFAWDSRPAEEGGQRWYHLYPDEYIGPGDPLHWTGRYFNWNYMCAECHSTNVQLNYDLGSDSFDTTYDEISVGCEACHGPGSAHVAQAGGAAFDQNLGLLVELNDGAGSRWVMNMETGTAERTAPNERKQQPESCGRCHSRRSVIAVKYEHDAPLTGTHMPALLEEGLYHADGRIQDEVYVYGSFIQSRMYAAGVTCSDCHDPHSGRLHAGPEPNVTCAKCHMPSRFASSGHGGEMKGDCVGCHMPATTYMGVDDRRDHSFRIPGAGESADHYGPVIAAGREGGANRQLLRGIANQSFPPIARATMLTLLEPVQDAAQAVDLLDQLESDEPLVRIAALRALQLQPDEVRLRSGSRLLRDPVRGVRIEAALTYAGYSELLSAQDAFAFTAAAREYREAMLASAFMPDAALNLAEFESRIGNIDDAERMYSHALRTGGDLAPVRHAYGLFLVRSGQHEAALEHLRRAAELEPHEARFSYVYGVALNSLGQPDNAIQVLVNAREKFPENFEIAWALATIYRDLGELDAARSLAREMGEEFPGNGRVESLARSLDAAATPQ